MTNAILVIDSDKGFGLSRYIRELAIVEMVAEKEQHYNTTNGSLPLNENAKDDKLQQTDDKNYGQLKL
jgi:hypothetical protein